VDRMDTMSLFVAAIDTGSLSGAAKVSGISLSSVSRHLSALEERVGTKLLIRTTRTLALTEAGHRYYDTSKRLLTEIDDMEAGLHTDAETPVGRLHVAGPTLFGRFFMLPLLAKFAVMHPKIVMDVMLLDRQLNLIEEGIDVAVRIGPMVDSSLIIRKLGALRWIICAAPLYLEQRGTPHTLADLSGHDCLAYSQHSISSEWEWQLLDGDKPTQVQVPVRMRSNTLDGVVAAAVEGAGLVYAPAWSVMNFVKAGRLKVILSKHELPPYPINAVFTHNRLLSGKVRALVDYLALQFVGTDFDSPPPLHTARLG
jgi:DNA-binding transcriptional LysR family regulator